MSRIRCLVLDDYQGVAPHLADWSRLTGVDVVTRRDHVADEDALVEALRGAAVVVAMRERTPFPRRLLERLPDLRLLVTTGLRNASIDAAAAADLGITVCGTRSRSEPPVELTWALLLGLARRLDVEHGALRAGGPWQSTLGVDLHGATLGLLGLGKIGSRVAAVGLAFGMDVVAWSPHLTDERAAEVGVRRAPGKLDLFGQADVLSLHLVLGPATRHVVGAAELAAMKPTALLVNTSRAGLVDTDALLAALEQGRLAGAAVDVYDEEPLPPDHPWRTARNVLTTPHLGYVTEGNYRIYFADAVEDIEAWLAGDPVRVLAGPVS